MAEKPTPPAPDRAPMRFIIESVAKRLKHRRKKTKEQE